MLGSTSPNDPKPIAVGHASVFSPVIEECRADRVRIVVPLAEDLRPRIVRRHDFRVLHRWILLFDVLKIVLGVHGYPLKLNGEVSPGNYIRLRPVVKYANIMVGVETLLGTLPSLGERTPCVLRWTLLRNHFQQTQRPRLSALRRRAK